MPNKSICFVGLDNYPVLNPEKGNDSFGGESVQQTLLAKAFRDLDYDVSMIVKDHDQPQEEIIERIRVFKTYRETEGVPIIRFFYPRLSSVLLALKMANADIYYQSCAGSLTGVVANYCKRHNKKFIFRLAHDSDCIPGEQLINLWRDRKIYEYGLKNALLIAAQGINQVDLLKQNYKIESVPVNMAVELPGISSEIKKSIDILWVNNYRDFKRPELVLDLAKKLPNYNITMVGGEVTGHQELFKFVQKNAENFENLTITGSVPYQYVNKYFLESKIFINTSDSEGFPNSFLQAWIRGLPVVSFFDPDDLIVRKNMGYVPNDIDDMANIIGDLLSDDSRLDSIAETAKKYVFDNYSPLSVAKKYESLIA